MGEATPSYIRDPETPKLIHDVVPDARIIILLRDPVQRAFSAYLMRVRNGIEDQTFHNLVTDCLEKRKNGIVEYNLCLDPGLYSAQVKRYFDMFGEKQVKILIFEEFIKEPAKTVKKVLEFLGVDAEPPDSIGKTYNPYGEPRGKIAKNILASNSLKKLATRAVPQSLRWKLREKFLLKKETKPTISKEDEQNLEQFYKNDVRELKVLLKRNLPWEWINSIS